MPESDLDIFDPEVFRIPRGAPVWVAWSRPYSSTLPIRLHLHRMKNNMLFRGFPETIRSLDSSQARILVSPINVLRGHNDANPGSRSPVLAYNGHILRFCTFVDHGQNQVGKTIVELGLNPVEFSAVELAKVCYSTFWTGKESWPFIVAESYKMADGHCTPPKY